MPKHATPSREAFWFLYMPLQVVVWFFFFNDCDTDLDLQEIVAYAAVYVISLIVAVPHYLCGPIAGGLWKQIEKGISKLE